MSKSQEVEGPQQASGGHFLLCCFRKHRRADDDEEEEERHRWKPHPKRHGNEVWRFDWEVKYVHKPAPLLLQ